MSLNQDSQLGHPCILVKLSQGWYSGARKCWPLGKMESQTHISPLALSVLKTGDLTSSFSRNCGDLATLDVQSLTAAADWMFLPSNRTRVLLYFTLSCFQISIHLPVPITSYHFISNLTSPLGFLSLGAFELRVL
jgi:hypothetical protein